MRDLSPAIITVLLVPLCLGLTSDPLGADSLRPDGEYLAGIPAPSETLGFELASRPARYDEIARLLTGKPDAEAVDGIDWVHDLCNTLDVTPLIEFGVTEDHFFEIIAGAKRASSMKGNPIELTDEELIEILKKAV